MGEKMSLQDHAAQLRKAAAEIRRDGHPGWGNACEFAADAIDAYITQPAQAVDDAMIERSRNRYRFVCGLNDECEDDTIAWKEAIAAALSGEQP